VVKSATLPLAFAIALAGVSASAQSEPPVRATKPGEIAIVSRLMAARYEDCRQQANQQHLHLLARQRFLKQCRAAP